MTPLIDVIFLIIIFFIILINFSQVHIRNVILPNADQAYVSDNRNRQQLLVTIKSVEEMFLQHDPVKLATLGPMLARRSPHGRDATVLIRASQEVPYELIKKVMIKLAAADIDKVQFATWEGPPAPLHEPAIESATALPGDRR